MRFGELLAAASLAKTIADLDRVSEALDRAKVDPAERLYLVDLIDKRMTAFAKARAQKAELFLFGGDELALDAVLP